AQPASVHSVGHPPASHSSLHDALPISFDIVGYSYRVETLCPGCTVRALTGHDAGSERHTAVIDRVASSIKIDNYRPGTYDSNEFPKVVCDDQLEDDDRCEECGGSL